MRTPSRANAGPTITWPTGAPWTRPPVSSAAAHASSPCLPHTTKQYKHECQSDTKPWRLTEIAHGLLGQVVAVGHGGGLQRRGVLDASARVRVRAGRGALPARAHGAVSTRATATAHLTSRAIRQPWRKSRACQSRQAHPHSGSRGRRPRSHRRHAPRTCGKLRSASEAAQRFNERTSCQS